MTAVLQLVELVWLLVVSIALLAVIRYVGALQAAGGGAAAERGNAVLEADGPWIPSPLPDRALAALQARDIPVDDLVVTFFSPRCGSCLERAEQVVAVLTNPARNVFLVAGDEDGAKDLCDILRVTDVPIMLNPDAQNIIKALDINSTPYTFRVVEGKVVAKSYLHDAADYQRMLTAGDIPASTTLPDPGHTSVPAAAVPSS